MAKAKVKKTTKDEIVKSLQAVSKRLNSNVHKAVDGGNAGDNPAMVTVYQVWCPRERKAIGPPTTDPGSAEFTRSDHNTRTGHNSRIIPE